jgi:effector-binding domain-containing protein
MDVTETLGYEILKQDGDFELRQYNSYILAQVESSSNMKDATYAGFMKLFNYISGNNSNRAKILMTIPVTEEQVSTSEKIPMTAPVTTERSSNNAYVTSFVMPSSYSMETLPEPKDKSITFRQVPAHRAAVVRFSGRMTEELAGKKIEGLKQWMNKNNLEPKSNFVMAQFNPPWIPGFMRQNEVMVDV